MSSGKGRTFANEIFLFWRDSFLTEVIQVLKDDSAKKSAGIFPRCNDRYFRINGSDEEVLVPSCQGIVSQYLFLVTVSGLPSGGDGQKPARDDRRSRENHDPGCVVLAIPGKQGFCPYVGSGSGYHLLSLVSISPVGCSCWCYST